MAQEWRICPMAESREKIAHLIKTCRLAKGLTQSQLAECSGLSLRSIQRIESGAVIPRAYTLNLLADQLGFDIENLLEVTATEIPSIKYSTPKRLILTISVAILFLLLAGAFLSQSSKFPETNFEHFIFWSIIIGAYTVFLLRLWK